MRTVTGLFLTSILVLLSGEPVHGGQPTWPHTWGGPGAAGAQSIAFDSKDSVYVGGNTATFERADRML